MESFLVKFEPISVISIITALYKRVEAGEWTDVLLNEALDAIPIDDVARLTKLREFGSGDVLNRRNVEVPWVVNASKNFETLKNEVHKSELQKIKIADLGYDHPLCSGILDDSSVPFTKMPEKLCKIFNASKKNKRTERIPKSFGSAKYISKVEAYIETEAVVNEGSYICEVISPLLNITMNDLPVDTDIWGVCSASAQRKGTYKSARRPDFMVIAQVNNKEIEVGYLETDAIDTTTNSKNDSV
ncbi:13143_t:CDS:2 [Gigaspora margarita]|uniref:13143_t:CDS:1 n=1 Tax=Gigaspora margarita TaxID=4874 RepID=A0ABN7UHK7_GIGMA|nr:13143_t:CDS:2 [Gigaspora margarita]